MARINQSGTAAFNGTVTTITLFTAPAGSNVNIDYLQLAAMTAIATISYKVTLGSGGPVIAWLTPEQPQDGIFTFGDRPAVLPASAALVLIQSAATAQTINWAFQGNQN